MTLSTEQLTYSYRKGRIVLRGVDFTLPKGLTALLGENGAGKSTLMRLLATEIPAHRADGNILLPGQSYRDTPLRDIRRALGWVPQHEPFDPSQRVVAALSDVASLRGIPRADRSRVVGASLQRVQLADSSQEKIANLSGGMARRVTIAAALLNEPEILLLDEPTAGLDPRNRRSVLNVVQDLAQNGMRVLMSTHVAADVRDADHILFLSQGAIALNTTVADFQQRYGDIDTAFERLVGVEE